MFQKLQSFIEKLLLLLIDDTKITQRVSPSPVFCGNPFLKKKFYIFYFFPLCALNWIIKSFFIFLLTPAPSSSLLEFYIHKLMFFLDCSL